MLVLSACGTGIPVYLRLQKRRVPFCTGILYTNDIDYRVARLLAAEVIAEKSLCAISDRSFARKAMDTAGAVGITIGECNRRMQELLALAGESGKLERGDTNALF